MGEDGGGSDKRRHERWGLFRFAVVGPLLAAPPESGELRSALGELSDRAWRHPITGEPMRLGRSTIERWYYQACKAGRDPVGALRRKLRSDAGRQSALSDALARALTAQYQLHKSWSAQLHTDNLAVLVKGDRTLGPMASYATVRRFLSARGLERRRRVLDRPGMARAEQRLSEREVRSFELAHVHGLWHLDFHHGSHKVLLPDGQWVKPLLLGVLDDRSRLACHVQWYLAETAESLVHGLSQAIQKRGLPRALLTDNGAAMIAEETRSGLARLGIVHETTLPYSPYQNAKQEIFWAQVEGRLMAMLEGVSDLTLRTLNQATQAWVELEYHRRVHSETGQTPLARLLAGPDVGRDSPASESLRQAFLCEVERTQRKSDGTVSLEGRRLELPGRLRHLRRVSLRYASWDLSYVLLVDPRTNTVLARIYPLDKEKNSSGERRLLGPVSAGNDPPLARLPASAMAPLLAKLIADYAATGAPPAYIPTAARALDVDCRDPQDEEL